MSSRAFGYACGVTMAPGASISFVAAGAGMLGGLAADDMILARLVVAVGLIGRILRSVRPGRP